MAMPAYIPSPSINSFNIGPLVIHFYALMYLVGPAGERVTGMTLHVNGGSYFGG